MIYPEFLKKGDTIGICALSAGTGDKLEELEESLSVLHDEGYLTKETGSVRSKRKRSASAKTRARELDSLVKDDEVKMIMLAAGGDVQMETVPFIDYDSIAKHPKWIMGLSDPTNLLFPVTTMLDIATLYGFNGAAFTKDHGKEQDYNLSYLKGDLVTQKSFSRYQTFLDAINENNVTHRVEWQAKEDMKIHGRCIGGCLDVIEKLIGTKYDHVNDFIDRYRDDGIVWYFDNFAMSAYSTYLTLLQFRMAGYFRYCKGVLIGRTAFPSIAGSDVIFDYESAYKLALKDIPYITEMDIGHTRPRMTMINGALIDVTYKNHKGTVKFHL